MMFLGYNCGELQDRSIRLFWQYFVGVGTKFSFLFTNLLVSKDKKCFDKLIMFPDGSDLF